MVHVDGRDFIGALLLGAAIATGNPAYADFGVPSIILPALVALALLAFLGRSDLPPARVRSVLSWTAALYIAFILLWYEQYKLTGDEGSVDLFTKLTDWAGFHGHEKIMRLGVGICEIIASAFLLVPAVQGLGGIGALMLMSGAIFFHIFTPLGVDPYGDGGILFKEACSVWISSLLVIWWRRNQLVALARRVGLPVPAMLAA
ncbi:MAG: hypothetical protein K2P80_10830 [Beijerinckiaceae bacterium]|nr:hypothetical protein [Beijerinckiaceae bacterium]